MSGPTDALQYVRGHLEEALATDGRVGEQGLHVVVAGNALAVRGFVATPARRDAIGKVAAEVAPEYEVRNETRLVALDEPEGEERVG